MPSLYSYILTHDTGFSPNPFRGVLTLACCKPLIRSSAKVGGLIVGLTPKRLGHRLAFAMVVGERLTFRQYWGDPRFRAKRPVWHAPKERRVGDNCYEPLADGSWMQHRCMHSAKDGGVDARQMAKDLGGEAVLIARRWWYLGQDGVPLPKRLAFLVAGRGHRRIDDAAQVRAVMAFLDALPEGVQGGPDGQPKRLAAGVARAGKRRGARSTPC